MLTHQAASRDRVRVRILTTYPLQDASRRLRIEPLIHQFRVQGLSIAIEEIFTPRAFKWKNAPDLRRACAAMIVLANLVRRLIIILAGPRDEILLVHREAFPFFTPVFERLAVRRAVVSVLDVDDAVYSHVTHGRDWRRFFRNPRGAYDYSKLFDVILCGNYQLVEVYGQGCAQTLYAPTCPERAVHKISPKRTGAAHELVWIGSQSTLPSLLEYLPAIKQALKQTSSNLLVLGGNNVLSIEEDEHIDVALWSPEREIEALTDARVGIMPLPDTVWERGKSGYKAIMYMCSGLVAVVSPVGFNNTLCEKYGAVACSDEDWTAVLVNVIQNWHPVPPSQLERVRSDFDPESIAQNTCQAIMSALHAKDCFAK